ncbi:MAG: hypothetical protein HKP61_04225 [Dactylosporangium sp.]|nr:hypothetical protein [Dactylosporangium sp.]NNJ60159.1 hypothetical protein [Dactylosporangium sp.]
MADQATTPAGKARARMLRLTPRAVEATPTERVERFSITTILDHLDHPVAPTHPARYRARWAATSPRTEHAILEGHTGPVTGVCAVTVEGRTMLASTSNDQTIRLWNPTTGNLVYVYTAAASCTAVNNALIVGLHTGLISIAI